MHKGEPGKGMGVRKGKRGMRRSRWRRWRWKGELANVPGQADEIAMRHVEQRVFFDETFPSRTCAAVGWPSPAVSEGRSSSASGPSVARAVQCTFAHARNWRRGASGSFAGVGFGGDAIIARRCPMTPLDQRTQAQALATSPSPHFVLFHHHLTSLVDRGGALSSFSFSFSPKGMPHCLHVAPIKLILHTGS